VELKTPRLILRRWRDSDREPFAALNADPEVMEHFPATLSREESDAAVQRFEEHFSRKGFGLWAVEVVGGAPLIGFTGLVTVPFYAPFTPAVEVGWRLAREHWGHGYATEAATGALRFGFEEASLREIVSFTTPGNVRSQRVMQKLGMHRDPGDDFDNPRIPDGHPLRRHVLYRLTREEWRRRGA
jgi:RimJ/RimL family protein N-acetyltransferase